MSGIIQNTKKTTKQIAIDAVKRISNEPLEILRTATKQTTGLEYGKKSENGQNQGQSQDGQNPSEDKKVDEQKMRAQSVRLVQAFEKELEDIRRQKKEEEMQKLQAEQTQKQQTYEEEEKKGFFGSIIPQGKKRRTMGGGKGKKGPSGPTGTTKTEVRKPPSG